MTTGILSGTPSRMVWSEGQIEDSVGCEFALKAEEDSRKHTPNTFGWSQRIAKPRRTQETHTKRVWLVTEFAKVLNGNKDTHAKKIGWSPFVRNGQKNIGARPSASIHRLLCSFPSQYASIERRLWMCKRGSCTIAHALRLWWRRRGRGCRAGPSSVDVAEFPAASAKGAGALQARS
jgi:hypothetical protein